MEHFSAADLMKKSFEWLQIRDVASYCSLAPSASPPFDRDYELRPADKN